jgi:hypothetical protein
MNRQEKAARNRDKASRLNEEWGIGAAHARYRETGNWYHLPKDFPFALIDPHGYVLYDTEKEFRAACGKYLKSYDPAKDQLKVRIPWKRISKLPGYVRADSVASSRASLGNRNSQPWQRDLEARLRIELAAIQTVAQRYEKRGYIVRDVQKGNKGWDLEAVRDGTKLRLEVKGLASVFQTVELTPNEFSAMNKHAGTFRLCVISNLEAARPKIHIYRYSREERLWISRDESRLRIAIVQSAKCSPV